MSNVEIFCLVCGDTQIQDVTAVEGKFKLVKCTSCGFVFIIPRPDIEELKEYYNAECKYNYEPAPMSKEVATSSVKDLHKLIEYYMPKARNILEIGCSYGHIIYGLKERGYEVVGTDLSESACRYAQKHYCLKVYNSEFPPDEFMKYFDVLILSQVIEHVLDPVAFLRKASYFLREDGIVFIGTPNIDCILFDVFGRHLEMISPPQHISFFNPKSIEMLLQRCKIVPSQIYTKTHIWVDWNFFNHLFLSILRLFNITQTIRKKVDPSIKSAIASSTGITRKSTILSKIKLVVDFSTKVFSLLACPILKIIDKKGKGLILYAIGKNQ